MERFKLAGPQILFILDVCFLGNASHDKVCLVGMAMDWVNEQQVSTIDRRERAQDVARRLGRQMPGQHVLVPYNGTIYAAQLSFETGVGPFVLNRALSL